MNTIWLSGTIVGAVKPIALPDNPGAQLRLAFSNGGGAGFTDVTVFGPQAERARLLMPGTKVAVAGRLRFSEWETSNGDKRQSLSIVAGSLFELTALAEAE